MFSRVLKSTNQQTQPAPSSPAPTTPTKSRSSGHAKSQSTAGQPNPSKIPVPTTPSSRSSFIHGAKENLPAHEGLAAEKERSNYLSFLFSQNQSGAPTTPVKVNPKVQQSTAPPQVSHVHGHHDRYHNPYESEDVHMQTMKNTVNPAMLKQLAAIPPQGAAPALAPPLPARAPPANGHLYAAHRNLASEDVQMRTAKHDVKPEEKRQLQLWERELLEKAEVRRKATVAQLCQLICTTINQAIS